MDPSANPSLDAPTVRGPAPGITAFGRYRLERLLGTGGMGVVWLAQDLSLGVPVALKFLPEHIRWDASGFDDLKRETRRARQLTHPSIVRIHDFVEDAQAAAISMEFVDGRSLAALRAAAPAQTLSPDDLRSWIEPLASALDYAHREARIVHRDLKPANLLLSTTGSIKISDFGIARSLVDGSSRVSQSSGHGTLTYVSPQQLWGEPPAPSDDLYALGATLYELLAGEPPFLPAELLRRSGSRRPEAIQARRQRLGLSILPVPLGWEEAITACLDHRPERRPASATALAARLLQKSGNRKIGKSGNTETVGLLRSRPRVRRSLLVAASLTLLATLTTFTWMQALPQPVASPVAASASTGFSETVPFDALPLPAPWSLEERGNPGGIRTAKHRLLVTPADREAILSRPLRLPAAGPLTVSFDCQLSRSLFGMGYACEFTGDSGASYRFELEKSDAGRDELSLSLGPSSGAARKQQLLARYGNFRVTLTAGDGHLSCSILETATNTELVSTQIDCAGLDVEQLSRLALHARSTEGSPASLGPIELRQHPR
jgi:serine/threonine protein kinase